MSDQVQESNPIPIENVDQVPVVDQLPRVAFLKADLVHDLVAYRGPTEGQMVMAKMLVSEKNLTRELGVDELKKKARPAGYAIGFAQEPTHIGQDLGRNLFNEGMMVFPTTIEDEGKTAFVAADKDGLFFIQEGNKRTGESFLNMMNDKLNSVGDQEENCIVRVETGAEANARSWNPESVTVTPVPFELAPKVLKLVSDESLKAPLITVKDVEVARKRIAYQNEIGKEDLPLPPQPTSLKDINF